MQKIRPHLSLLSVTVWFAVTCCGCSDERATDDGNVSATDSAVSQSDSSGTAASDQPADADGLSKDADGRQWYGDVPLDVWFDDPLSVAANSTTVPEEPTTVAGVTTAGTPADTPAETLPSATSGADGGTAPESDQAGWLTVMPQTIFDAEIIRIRTKLGASLNTVSSYNLAMTEIPPDIGELAALANIAVEQDMGVTWGERAHVLRDLAASMVEQPLMRGAATQRRLKTSFEAVQEILNGNSPAGLPDADPGSDFGTKVDYGLLMKRIERGSNWLKTNIVSAESMKEKMDEGLQECYVVAAVARIITHEDYGYSDDTEYLGYANPMRDAALQMATAIKQEDYETFDTGISQVLQACSRCHTPYRNN